MSFMRSTAKCPRDLQALQVLGHVVENGKAVKVVLNGLMAPVIQRALQ